MIQKGLLKRFQSICLALPKDGLVGRMLIVRFEFDFPSPFGRGQGEGLSAAL